MIKRILTAVTIILSMVVVVATVSAVYHATGSTSASTYVGEAKDIYQPATATVVEAKEPDQPQQVAEETATPEVSQGTLLTYGESTYVEENPVDVDKLAYVNTITPEEIQSIKDFLEAEPDIDGIVIDDFIAEFGDKFPELIQDEKGEWMYPLNYESLSQKDSERPDAAIKAGLNKEGKPIDDALAFPFDLSYNEVQEILKLKVGKKADFGEARIEELKVQLFKYLLGSPIGLEAYFNLLNKQKIADQFTLEEYWKTGKDYLQKCEESRQGNEAKGINVWLREFKKDSETRYFTNAEHIKYCIALHHLLWPRKAEVAVYTAKANDHYHLVDLADFNSMRVATPADYKETLASLIFPFYTKDGRIAFRFGSNIRDKRPEILNYSATKKPVVNKKPTPTPIPPVVVSPTTTIATWATTTTTTTTVPGNPNNPPGPGPGPNNPETKAPSEGTKAQTGGGQKTDPGPGEQKPDQGNGDGEYKPGTSENPTPPSNGGGEDSPPPTAPIEEHPSNTENGTAGGDDGGAAGGDNGNMGGAPPASD